MEIEQIAVRTGESGMPFGFERDRIYNRRTDIHARFRGQQQGGIITPVGHPLVIIITGAEGLTHGYSDQLREDGAFEYFGEGQVGDMQMIKGNVAIRDHSANGKSLLLFRKTKDGLRFLDEYVYETHRTVRAPDRNGDERDAYVFELQPLESIQDTTSTSASAPTTNLATLRARAMSASRAQVSQSTATRTVFERSKDVRDYVVARAAGDCEGCGSPAPFIRTNGTPYLEPHHIRRVSDGGPDDPHFVIALCPNCHRRVHHGVDGQTYNADLLATMARLEPAG
ncbi:HNH endonuclease [uncultured Hoeflea sp.]|uniref:HNH endonuclease n=1 Tax=uncultured Hoeflea sp. TaxID=538666 RepID=UPI00261ABC60|nr:HNH endonuclease [uncultured Hoeflea sp.]